MFSTKASNIMKKWPIHQFRIVIFEDSSIFHIDARDCNGKSGMEFLKRHLYLHLKSGIK